ncbi:sensor histidine kinase [Actinacidiphila sp. bgisy160]|uniref:sensor histidine kinase n=1 Tax=Actinacidiphila sp. bgisy160 TaxID=3413796 RepID=UPI003D70B824
MGVGAAVRKFVPVGLPRSPGLNQRMSVHDGGRVPRAEADHPKRRGHRCWTRRAPASPFLWIAAHRGSLRLQLTAVFGLMFFLAASAVLAATVLLVVRYLHWDRQVVAPEAHPKIYSVVAPEHRGAFKELSNEDRSVDPVLLHSDVWWLLKWGSLVVVIVGITATAAGWWVAGRLLRPLTKITRTAERVAGSTLHQRISLEAPPGEVKTLADSFDHMLERLDESFAGQGRFIANAAHELKTPLALNRTLVEVAMNRRDATASLRHLGEDLLRVNARQERLIDALLALARSDSGTVERLPTDLRLVAETVLDASAAAAREAGIALRGDLDVAPLQGDPTLLEQLARNLVDNAIRYNHHGGTVRVITRFSPEAAVLTVTNTGPSIAPHEVPTLFQPFRRLTDRVGSAKGSGLGLSIVQAIAHTHGGEAEATPRPEGGLTISVTLPHRGARPR